MDGGATWIGAVLFTDVTGFAIDPVTPTTVYVTTRRSGVFKSFDAGGNWFSFNDGLPPSLPTAQVLAIVPLEPTTVYVGMQTAGVFKSEDGGNWKPVNSGLTNLAIQALAVDPLDSATVYAGTSAGVFMSENVGATWGGCSSCSSSATDLTR